MNRTLYYTIHEPYVNLTITDYLKLQGYSHRNLVTLKKIPQSILVNNQWVYTSYILKLDDQITIHLIEDETEGTIVPVALPLNIIYEDEDILVINKDSNCPIHPSLHNYDNTLANGVMHYYKQQGKAFVFRCVNRLDRDTTGLTIVAKHSIAASNFSTLISEKTLKRTYLAICEGDVYPSAGTISAPIARVAGSTIERTVDFEHGEHAVTHYETIEKKDGLTLLALRLETGRTHQIRVHMKYLSYPIIGDFLYHPLSLQMPRQALHAYQLEFTHPFTKEHLILKAPLPKDMLHFFSNIPF